MSHKNIILKGIGGFYYVKTQNGVVECRAKGIFRNKKISPVAGDIVKLQEEAGTFVIAEIEERKNFFIRPPIANIDNFFIVISTVDPVPNTLVIDKLLAIAVNKGAVPFLIFTKTDLHPADALYDIYSKSNVPIFSINATNSDVVQLLKNELSGKLSVFCGNSGVGKSTLLSNILPDIELETGQISRKLKRGRHTTREVALYEVCNGFVADTPGFGTVEMEKACFIKKDELQYAFIEFSEYIGKCKFADCSHVKEIGCAVKQAVEDQKITKSRYENYKTLYSEALLSESKQFN